MGGSFFPLLAPFVPRSVVLLGLGAAALAFGVLDGLRLSSPRIAVWLARRIPLFREEEQHRPTGSTYFIAASLLAFLIFDVEIAANALLLHAVGDPVAAAVGSRWGRHRWRGKSLEGSLACLAVAGAIGGLFQLTGLGLDLPLLALAALATTLYEFLPLPVDDNLRVPLLTAGTIALAGGLL